VLNRVSPLGGCSVWSVSSFFSSQAERRKSEGRTKGYKRWLEDYSEGESRKEKRPERMSANKSVITDRSHGAQVQARTGNQQGGYCCMNLIVHVLHLLCTIGKKEEVYLLGLIAWQKGVPDIGWRIKMKQKCFYVARRLDEQTSSLHGDWRIVQNHKIREYWHNVF
jgi:hypothetical protein